MTVTIAHIRRYPVKGMTVEELSETVLEPDRTLPGDRRFALALGSTPVTGPKSEWMPKTSFLSLLRHEKLATLAVRFEPESGVLTIERQGRRVARGNAAQPVGRAMIEEFFDAYMGDAARGRPRLVEAEDGHVLTDVPDAVISIINLASVKDLERVTGKPVDPVRFRANVYVAGLPAWQEFDWIDHDITAGEGTLRVTKRIERCAATSVDPGTGQRDLNIPAALQRGFGHADMGVYARVTRGGRLAVGDRLEPSN